MPRLRSGAGIWHWSGFSPMFTRRRWLRQKQLIRLNTPVRKSGSLRRCAFRRHDVRQLRAACHGGTTIGARCSKRSCDAANRAGRRPLVSRFSRADGGLRRAVRRRGSKRSLSRRGATAPGAPSWQFNLWLWRIGDDSADARRVGFGSRFADMVSMAVVRAWRHRSGLLWGGILSRRMAATQTRLVKHGCPGVSRFDDGVYL